jgi:hypothetical protein
MAEYYIPTEDEPKQTVIIEPFPVTDNNICTLSEPLVFTNPRFCSGDKETLVQCVEGAIEQELEKGDYGDEIAGLMDIKEDACQLKQKVREWLVEYDHKRDSLVDKFVDMHLAREGRGLDRIEIKLDSMQDTLTKIESSMKCLGRASCIPLRVLTVRVNGTKKRLSISDELRYIQLFSCQILLIKTGVVMSREPMGAVEAESKKNCAKALEKLKAVSKDKGDSETIATCFSFLVKYASYMWNLSELYKMTKKGAEVESDSILSFKASVTRHCINQLKGMMEIGTEETIRKYIGRSQNALRVSLNCVLMMHYYKEHKYELAYRAHKRTSALIERDSLKWLNDFKRCLDRSMEMVLQVPRNSWDLDIAKEDDTGEFGPPKGVKMP